jgi:hypothetical protein
MRRGQWTRWNHRSSGYNNDHAFRFYSPPWVFGSDGPLASWCQQFPQGADVRNRDVYQFGVYTGGTMAGQVMYYRALDVRFGHQWGFDSFIGLPPEKQGHKLLTKNWREGAYSAADSFRTWQWDRLERKLLDSINRSKSEGSVTFVKGFFNESLTPTLAAERRMLPALFVDVDSDLYISTIQCLEWLFCSGLVHAGSRNGTVFRYDDWGGPTKHTELVGERLAHLEITNRHQVHWSHSGLLSNWFRIERYSLDHSYCEAKGYPRLPPTLGRDDDADRYPPSDSDEAIDSCFNKTNMWRRPYVSRGGMRVRCADRYLRDMVTKYEWALRPIAELTNKSWQDAPEQEVAKARLRVCDINERHWLATTPQPNKRPKAGKGAKRAGMIGTATRGGRGKGVGKKGGRLRAVARAAV